MAGVFWETKDIREMNVEELARKLGKYEAYISRKVEEAAARKQLRTEKDTPAGPRGGKQEEEEEDLGHALEETPQLEQKSGQHDTTKNVILEEEEIDLDMQDPDLEKAAVKIQNVFRLKKSRQKAQQEGVEQKDQDQDIEEDEVIEELILEEEGVEATNAVPVSDSQNQKDISQIETSQAKKETDEQIAEEDIDWEKEEEKAAVKIQAIYKGKQERRRVEKLRKEKQQRLEREKKEEEAAAVKIQAIYKGKMERRKIQNLKKQKEKEDQELEEAAVKIQSVFKGKRARREIKAEKVKQKEEEDAMWAKKEEEAAVRIQAIYKGKKARQQVQSQICFIFSIQRSCNMTYESWFFNLTGLVRLIGYLAIW